jgi:hypothetical protein|tara:strand:+ start:1566 stop:1772 length:207 start_codon:yes stop_codon:yes gene_type:complete
MLEHDDRKIIINKKLMLNFEKIINTPSNYLKYPDQEGSLTEPLVAGSLNFAPLKVTPASSPIPSSLIA